MTRTRILVVAVPALALALLAAGPALALTGTVVDHEGKPLRGARVCYLLGGEEGICSATDGRGFFELPTSSIDRIQISASGFLPRTVAAVAQSKPIALERAGALWVRLKDPDGNPIGEGEVYLVFPSGARKGPFPVNAKGVRIRTLPVDSYRVLAQVQGYAQERSASVTLEAGKEARLEIVLAAAESKSAR